MNDIRNSESLTKLQVIKGFILDDRRLSLYIWMSVRRMKIERARSACLVLDRRGLGGKASTKESLHLDKHTAHEDRGRGVLVGY